MGLMDKPKLPLDTLFKIATGYAPYQYQKTIIENESKRLVINKPRQVGITTAFAYKFMLKAMFGKKCLVVSRSYVEATNFIGEIKKMLRNMLAIPEFSPMLRKILSVRVDIIEFTSGGYVKALANTSEAGRSYAVDYICLDEFAFYSNAEDLYTAILPTITTKKKYQIIVNSTPNGEGNMYAAIWREFEERGFERKMITMGECPIFTPEKISELKQGMDELSFMQEYMNAFLGSKLSYFPMDIINNGVDKTLKVATTPETLPIGCKLVFGVDIGRKIDKTAIIGVGQDNVVKFKATLERKPFKEQREFLQRLLPFASVMRIDRNGIGEQLAEELQTMDSAVVPVTVTSDLKMEGFIAMRRMFEQREITIPDDIELKRALNLIERVQMGASITFDAPRTDKTGHSDLAFALMFAVGVGAGVPKLATRGW